MAFGGRLSKAVRITRLRVEVSGIWGGGGGGRGAEDGPRFGSDEVSCGAAGCRGMLAAAASLTGRSGAAGDFAIVCCGDGAVI